MSEAEKKFSPLRRFLGRSLLSSVVLFSLFGHCQTLRAQAPPVTTPAPPKVVPTKITKIEPAIAQPGGTIFLTFDKPLKPVSVKIGNIDGMFAPELTQRLEVVLPTTVAVGRQLVEVRTETESIESAAMVAPRILGLRAKKDAPLQLSRVMVAGGEVIVQFSDKLPLTVKEGLKVRLVDTTPRPQTNGALNSEVDQCSVGTELSPTIPEDNYMIVKAPANFYDWAETTYALRVCADKTPLQTETRLKIQNTYWLYGLASAWVVFFLIVIYVLYRIGRKVKEKLQRGQRPQRYWFLKMLLLEQENQTYSLSRAQFLGWLLVIVWCYLFLYYAHGFIEESWGFPNLGNSIYAFLISLGTLVAAQATNRMGVKGAGEEHPSPADLVVHGGVIALDRVQQIIWTLIALGMFVRITVSTFSTATELPGIPTELLMLMGLSSAGYLGGKLVRGPGPVIEQVTVPSGTTLLNIKGKHLSKDAFVWFDGEQIKATVTSKVDDPDDPLKFAKELEVPLPISIEDWNAKDHAITVINSDAQRADFRIQAFPEPEITEVNPGAPDANGNVTLGIEGTGVAVGAKITIAADPSFRPVQDSTNPNFFTAQVPSSWTRETHQLLLESNGKVSSFTYPPSA